MALVKYGIIAADVRGSVGAVVFSRNAAGAIMRKRTTPTYPGTERQTNAASLLSTVINDWKVTLTTPQRDAWNALAAITSLPNKLGEQFTPSGLNLFVKANTMLDHVGTAHVTTPPVAAVAPTPQFSMSYHHTQGVKVDGIGNWDNSAAGSIFVQSFLSGPLSQNYYKGPYTGAGIVAFAAFDALPLVLNPTGVLVANTRCHYRFRAIHDDGSVSAAAFHSVDVGSLTE